MKKTLIFFSILFLVFSCTSKEEINKNYNPTRTYEKEGILFNLPKGWNVKQDYTDKNGRYFELDKTIEGVVENTMGISVFKNKPSTDSILANQVKQLKFFYQKVSFKVIEESKKSKIGKYEALFTSYEADDTQTKVYGKIYVFLEGENTISVQIVDNKPDIDDSDYQKIFNTFIIK